MTVTNPPSDDNALVHELSRHPRAKSLTHAEWTLLRQLAARVDPNSGWTRRVSDAELAGEARRAPATVKSARRRLRALGLISDYRAGSGRKASCYRLAASWDQADRVVARRVENGDLREV